MVVGGSRQETPDPSFVLLDTRQQGVPVILRELVLPDGFDPVSVSFTVRDVTTELSGPNSTEPRSRVSYSVFVREVGLAANRTFSKAICNSRMKNRRTSGQNLHRSATLLNITR
ncbi:unnamed protein product [Schistosoma curassoni]|uniref:Cadherin domain-containing protein n=1 Tax=Schistosoma curassoni TaxID=6186 RepID=A0A183K1N6_9TREM|nr:unnamed protein product [Schistosoma curassoni]